MTAAVAGCLNPMDPLCAVVPGLGGSLGDLAADAVLGALGASFVDAASSVLQASLAVLDSSTGVDLTAGWFRANVAVLAAVMVPVMVGVFAVQVMLAVLRREPGGLGRALFGVGRALVGSGIAVAATQLALQATDGICQVIAGSAGTTVAGAAHRFLVLTWLGGPDVGAVMKMLLGLAVVIGSLLLWLVMLFRKAAVVLVAVFAPVAFASATWTRRWMEAVAGLVGCKVVIVVAFVVGGSAFGGAGPSGSSAGGQDVVVASTAAGQGSASGLSDLLVGLLLLGIAVFAPWMTWRFVHWSGIEAGAALHSAVAGSPIPAIPRAAAAQARFTAQWAITSALTRGMGGGGPGIGGGPRRAGGPPRGLSGQGGPGPAPGGAPGGPNAPQAGPGNPGGKAPGGAPGPGPASPRPATSAGGGVAAAAPRSSAPAGSGQPAPPAATPPSTSRPSAGRGRPSAPVAGGRRSGT